MGHPDVTDPRGRAGAGARARARSAHPDVLDHVAVTTDAQARSRDALARGVAVVTGQQAGLFGGPLYTLHKAASAIVDARALEAETGVPCAPVFWLQDEDHDFDEIAAAWLLDAGGELREARVDGLPEEAGRSVRARRLGRSVDDALAVLDEALDGLPHAAEVLELLRPAHAPEASPAAAFRAGLDRLFARHGLLVVDAADPSLAAAARPVHLQAIDQARALSEALLETDGPILVRPGAPLSFVHPEGLDGRRFRVEPRAGGFGIVGTDCVLTAEQVRRGPHTTSALLRPILQDTWLPTAAYVGGPGELAYLPQVEPLWRAFGLPVPLVVPRARFLLVDAASQKLLGRLGLAPRDLEAPRADLETRLGVACGDRPDPDALYASLTEGALAALDAFAPHADGVEKAVVKTRATFARAAGRLVDRYRRSLARADAVTVDRLDRLLARLRPNGLPQERVHAWPPYGARHGVDALVDRLLAEVVPFDGALREVML